MNYNKTRFFCYLSSLTQATVNNFLPLLFVMFCGTYNVSITQLSFIVSLNFCVQLFFDVASIKIVALTGTRRAIIAAQFLCASGFVLLGILPRIMQNTVLAICISVVISAAGSGLLEVLVSPLMLRVSEGKGRSFMAFLHSFYCWGQILVVVITTLVIKFAGYAVWPYVAFFWALIPFFNAFGFMSVPVIEDVPENERTPLGKLFKSKTFLLLAGLILTGGASEVIIAQWASTFAETELNLPKLTGDLLGPCAFAFFMGIGRLISSAVLEKVSTRKMLIACGAISSVCYLTAALASNSILSVTACAVCGLGVSIMWPASCSLAGELFPSGGNAMFGMLAMAGDIGCIVGPWIAGMVAAGSNFKTALGISVVFPIIHFLILFSKKLKNKNI